MPSEDSPLTPPLRIHHLLLWMTMLALVGTWRLALNDCIADSPASTRSSNTSADTLRISSVQTVAWGGMVALTLLGVAWKWKDKRWRWPPGLWLAAYGTGECLDMLADSLPRLLGDVANSNPHRVMMDYNITLNVAIVAAFGWNAMRSSIRRPWRVAFGLLALDAILSVAWMNGVLAAWFWEHLNAINYVYRIGVAAVLIAAIIDLHGSARQGWDHWAGVLLWLLHALALRIYPWALHSYHYGWL